MAGAVQLMDVSGRPRVSLDRWPVISELLGQSGKARIPDSRTVGGTETTTSRVVGGRWAGAPDRGAATNHRPAGSGRAARALGTSTMVRVAPPLQPMLAATPGVPRPKRGPDLRLDLWAHEDFNLGPLPCQESPGLGRSADQRAKRGSPGMDVGPIHEKWGPFVLRVRPFGCLTALCAVKHPLVSGWAILDRSPRQHDEGKPSRRVKARARLAASRTRAFRSSFKPPCRPAPKGRLASCRARARHVSQPAPQPCELGTFRKGLPARRQPLQPKRSGPVHAFSHPHPCREPPKRACDVRGWAVVVAGCRPLPAFHGH